MKKVKEFLSADYRNALVVPAFERSHSKCQRFIFTGKAEEDLEYLDCVEEIYGPMPGTISQLARQFNEKKTRVFDVHNRDAHQSTNYREWFKLAPGKIRRIKCIKSNRYEPYLILRKCSLLPPYQEQFTGYGKNKIQHVLHLRHLNYNINVLGGAFVNHYPHPPSSAKKEWDKLKDEGHVGSKAKEFSEVKGFHRAAMDKFYLDFKEWLKRNVNATEDDPESYTSLCDGVTDDDGLQIK